MSNHKRSCSVGFEFVTQLTAILIWVNAEGRNDDEAVENAWEVLKDEWGEEIVIRIAALEDTETVWEDGPNLGLEGDDKEDDID